MHECCRPLVVGHPEILRRAVRLLNSPAQVVPIASPDEAQPSSDVIPCLKAGATTFCELAPGTIDARGGQAAYDALLVAAQLALAGKVDALTTAPLHKAALWRAGHQYPGHTELLAELCGVDDFAMMLYLGPGDGRARAGRAGDRARHAAHGAGRRVRGARRPKAMLQQERGSCRA